MIKIENLKETIIIRRDEEDCLVGFNGGIYKTNIVAYNILKLLGENISKIEIVESISNEYNISKEDAMSDFDDFIGQLIAIGIC